MRITKTQESREDYLEAILILRKASGFVRAVDLAGFMRFSKPSVSVALANLKRDGLARVGADGGIDLTLEGRRLAESVYVRHTALRSFFISIGVSEATAAADACRIEHVISEETFEKLLNHAKNAPNNS